MNFWQRLLALTSADPFTGPWMSLGTALGAIVVLKLLRRQLPKEDRSQGGITLLFLVVGVLLGSLRLALVAVGAGEAAAGRALATLTTFFVALGAVGTLLLFLFEVLPARGRVKLPTILRDLVYALAFVVVAFGVLSQTGVNIVSLITTSAVLTVVVGLALQSTLANLFAGIVLNMDRALNLGDWVQVGTRTGCVTQIRWRATILETTDGDTVIIPNSKLTVEEVYNFSRPTPRHRLWINVRFHYRHPPNEVRTVLIEAARRTIGVLTEPAPEAGPIEFGESAVHYALRVWIDDFSRRVDIESAVRTHIWYAARRANLEIPFPIRTIVNAPDSGTDTGAISTEHAERIAALKRNELFAPLGGEELELLATHMRKVEFAGGETIIRQGDTGHSMFLIVKGSVRVSLERQDGGRKDLTIVASLGPGDFFGEMSLMTGEARAATCTAHSDVDLYVIDRSGFQNVLTARPHVADQMSVLLTRRQETLARKGVDLSARTAIAADHQKRLLERIRDFFELS